MKSKLNLILSVLVFVGFSTLFHVSAGSLSLTKIGALDTAGKTYSEWWYTLENPLLTGKADASKEVSIKIDGTENKVTANASGDWLYQTSMVKGAHTIVLASGADSYTFTLHAGENFPGNTAETSSSTGSGTGVPSTGNDQLVALGIGLGLTLLATYFYIAGDNSHKYAPVHRMIKE